MNRLLLSVVATSAILAGLSTTLSAAPWQSINERKAILEARIEEGIRNGVITRPEAISLRGELKTLAALEDNYRRSGGHLSAKERADLDTRFDALALRIKLNRRNDHVRPSRWIPINERKRDVDRKIDEGIRRGSLTKPEAIILRGEFQTLVKLEEQYRRSRGVFTLEERIDLDRRLEQLSRRVTAERRDRDRR